MDKGLLLTSAARAQVTLFASGTGAVHRFVLRGRPLPVKHTSIQAMPGCGAVILYSPSSESSSPYCGVITAARAQEISRKGCGI